jgi:hypothetical protein
MPEELRVGMISWAHVHAEFRAKALRELPGARIVAISDDNEARGRAAAPRPCASAPSNSSTIGANLSAATMSTR